MQHVLEAHQSDDDVPVVVSSHKRKFTGSESESSTRPRRTAVRLKLVQLSGEVLVDGTWPITAKADCLYKACLATRPGCRCLLFEGDKEVSPLAALATLGVESEMWLQVVWLAELPGLQHRTYRSQAAFTCIKTDGSVVRWGFHPNRLSAERAINCNLPRDICSHLFKRACARCN